MAVTITKPSSQIGNTSNVAVYSMAPSFLPSALSKLLVFANASATATGSISGAGGISWNAIASLNPQGTGNSARLFSGDVGASPSSVAINVDYTGDNATGCTAAAVQITGPALDVVQLVQVASVGTNPVVQFPASVDSNNGYLVGIIMASGLGVITAPAGWTTIAASYATPATGLVVAYRAGGETAASFTFSSGAATGLAYIGVEIGSLAAVVPVSDPFGMMGFFGA